MTNNNTQDKCREEFEKLYPEAVGCKGKILGEILYNKSLYFQIFQAFQAAYNLREQEVQRLRGALEEIDRCCGDDYHGIGNAARQALQEATNKE